MALTRLERMIAASKRLPEDLQDVYRDLFLLAKSEEQICSERGISRQQLSSLSDQVVRNLRAASN